MRSIEITRAAAIGGQTSVPGAKNSALALLAAACLSDEPVTLQQLPLISDVSVVTGIIESLGGTVSWKGCEAVVDPTGIHSATVSPAEASKIRTAYYFAGALLARFKRVAIGYSGGDDFVSRPIDQHLKGFRAMGASITLHQDYYEIKADHLQGAEIFFDTITSGATMNLMMAAVRAKGRTVLRNAASDPEIVDLAVMLNEMGANIVGAGTSTIRIEGVRTLRGTVHSVIPDRLVAASFITALGITGGTLVLTQVVPEHLGNLTAKYRELGFEFESDDQQLVAHSTGIIPAVRARIGMYPQFSPDFQQPLTALLLKAEGVSVVSDRIYPLRFNQCPEFAKMGAHVRWRKGSVRIHGGHPLVGTTVHAGDIRAGTALILAGLQAEGRTRLLGAEHLDRGYEDAVAMFSRIGAPLRWMEQDAGEGWSDPRAAGDGTVCVYPSR